MKTKYLFLGAILIATMVSTAYAKENDSSIVQETEVASVVGTEQGYSLSSGVDPYEVVLPYDIDVYRATFDAGKSVYVSVSGDGDTDLDLYIYDENGNLIKSDTDSDDECFCKFTPLWTGKFTIIVKNLGSVCNRYRLRIVQ